jgi:hypothetical protein
MTVGEDIAAQTKRKMAWLFGLVGAWIALVILDVAFGFAKHAWIGLPVFIAFCGALVYHLFLKPVRCPSCASAMHSQIFVPKLSAPSWTPDWMRRLFPAAKYCQFCGVPFALPTNEVATWQRAP